MNEKCVNDDPELLKHALCILGDRYSALMIRHLQAQPLRFKEFEKLLPSISPRTLSQRLAMLEEQGLVMKSVCPESPGRLQYVLTSSGEDLDNVLHLLAKWSERHISYLKQIKSTTGHKKDLLKPRS